VLPIGHQLGRLVDHETYLVSCAGDSLSPQGTLLADRRSLARYVGEAIVGEGEEADTRPVYVVAADVRLGAWRGSPARLLGRYAGEATVGEAEEADTRSVYTVTPCCPPQFECVVAVDVFNRADGTPGGYWHYAAGIGAGVPAIIDNELGFVDASGAPLLHCTQFDRAGGSIEVEIVGQAGDVGSLVAGQYTASGGSWVFGERWQLRLTIQSDHHLFELGDGGMPVGNGLRRYFKIPGGPGDRRRIRLCWYYDEALDLDWAVGEVYDDENNLIFRERSHQQNWDESDFPWRHGVQGATSETLRMDNYLATAHGEYCPPCEFVVPNICIRIEEDDCNSFLRTGIADLRDPLPLPFEHCGFNADHIHLYWAGPPVPPFALNTIVGVAQDPAGDWFAFLNATAASETCIVVPLDLDGEYPTEENFLALLYETTLTDTIECGLGSGTVTAVVGPDDGSPCEDGYYDGGGGSGCCAEVDLPDEVHIFIWEDGEEIAQYILSKCFQSSGAFAYQDVCEVDHEANVLCGTIAEGVWGLSAIHGPSGVAWDYDEIGLNACSPLWITGSTTEGGLLYTFEVVE
jgi:hypothetical protein